MIPPQNLIPIILETNLSDWPSKNISCVTQCGHCRSISFWTPDAHPGESSDILAQGFPAEIPHGYPRVKIAFWDVASGCSLSLTLSYKIPSLTHHDVSCLVKSNTWFDWCAVTGVNLLVMMSLLVMLHLPQCREVPMQVQVSSVYKVQ